MCLWYFVFLSMRFVLFLGRVVVSFLWRRRVLLHVFADRWGARRGGGGRRDRPPHPLPEAAQSPLTLGTPSMCARRPEPGCAGSMLAMSLAARVAMAAGAMRCNIGMEMHLLGTPEGS